MTGKKILSALIILTLLLPAPGWANYDDEPAAAVSSRRSSGSSAASSAAAAGALYLITQQLTRSQQKGRTQSQQPPVPLIFTVAEIPVDAALSGEVQVEIDIERQGKVTTAAGEVLLAPQSSPSANAGLESITFFNPSPEKTFKVTVEGGGSKKIGPGESAEIEGDLGKCAEVTVSGTGSSGQGDEKASLCAETLAAQPRPFPESLTVSRFNYTEPEETAAPEEKGPVPEFSNPAESVPAPEPKETLPPAAPPLHTVPREETPPASPVTTVPREAQPPVLPEEKTPGMVETPGIPEEVPPFIPTAPGKSEPCCEERAGVVYFPATTDPLTPPEAQEAWNNPAMGAYHVFLHDASFYEQESELFVESPGVNFELLRGYRSNVKTKEGGLFGHKWDLSLNKRILPEKGEPWKDGLRAERERGGLFYFNGTGRRDYFKHVRTEADIEVKNFRGTFHAFVSTYEPPKGLFAELKRYVVKPGSDLPPLIAEHPVHPALSRHPDRNGRIFYVLRFKDGYREIYNCRGQILYAQDRNENTMTFFYGGPLHPLTFNPVLTRIADSAGRFYSFDYRVFGEGLVDTNYRNAPFKSVQPKMTLSKVTDFSGREVRFEYTSVSNEPVLSKVTEVLDQKPFETRYDYGQDFNMTQITLPRETASQGPPFVTNVWKGSQLVKQLVGKKEDAPQGGKTGGEYLIAAGNGSEAKITTRTGQIYRYGLVESGGAKVVGSLEEPREGGSKSVTVFSYNEDQQMIRQDLPEGNGFVFEYDKENEPVTQGDVRDEPGVTYRNNLSKGNLLTRKMIAGKKKNPLAYNEITVRYEYEPLFNQELLIQGPGKTETRYTYDHGWYASAGNNGNPLTSAHPDDGTTSFQYNAQGLLLQLTDSMDHKKIYTLQPGTGYILKLETPEGNLEYGRDSRGNMTRLTDALGTVTRFEVNQKDRVTRMVVDEKGFANQTYYDYDLNGNLTVEEKMVRDNIKDEKIFGDLPHSPMQKIQTRYEYDLLNQKIREIHEGGGKKKETVYLYDASQNMIEIQTPVSVSGEDPAHKIRLEYTPNRLLKSKTEGGQIVETYEYDQNNKLAAKSRGTGQEKTVLKYEYDGFDRLFRTLTPQGTVMDDFLEPGGKTERSEIRGRNGDGQNVLLAKTRYEYDAMTRPTLMEEDLLDSQGHLLQTRRTRYEYDKEGQGIKVIDSLGRERVFGYKNHRKISERDPVGNETLFEYDPAGNVTSMTDVEKEIAYEVKTAERGMKKRFFERRSTTRSEYDSLGRLTAVTDPSGRVTRYGYDSEGRMRGMLAPGGRLDYWMYDAFGNNLLEVLFANAGRHRLEKKTEFDLNDRKTSEEKLKSGASLGKESYSYTSTDRIKKNSRDGRETVFDYDSRGNLTGESLPAGIKVRRDYDSEDLPVKVHAVYPNDGPFEGSLEDIFAYDGLGRMTSSSRYGGKVLNKMAYTSFGDLVSEEQTLLGKSYTVRYEYNPLGQRTRMLVPSMEGQASEFFNYQYDAAGRLSVIAREAREGPQTEAEYEYTGFSRPARRTVFGGALASGDSARRLSMDMVFEYDRARQVERSSIFQPARQKVIWNEGIIRTQEDLPQRLVTRLLAPDRTVDTITFSDYNADQSLAKTEMTETTLVPAENTQTRETSSTEYSFENGRLSETRVRFESLKDAPGKLWGKNREAQSHESATGLTYQSNDAAAVQFTNGKESRKAALWYDADSHLTADERYEYAYDYTGRLGRIVDKYDLALTWRENARYFYDYRNRLVYIAHGPSDKEDVRYWRANRRILYDGALPLAELETDFDGKPKALKAFYVTHPKGLDIARMSLQEGTQLILKDYLSFFNPQGALVLLTDENGRIQKSTLEYEAPNRRAHLRHLIAGRSREERVEVPMMALGLRWESFSEMSVMMDSGQFLINYSRDLKQQWEDLLNVTNADLNQKITALQKEALAIMGIGFTPLLLATPWIWLQVAQEVLVDFGITRISGGEYGMLDALLSAEMSLAFGVGSAEQAALEGLIGNTVQRAGRQFAARATREALEHASGSVSDALLKSSDDLFSLGEGGLIQFSVMMKDGAARRAYWETIKDVAEEKVREQLMKHLFEAAEKGHKMASDFLDDMVFDDIRIVMAPELGAKGVYRKGDTIFVNPFRQKVGLNGKYQMGEFRELSATALHEYVHFRGYNEFRTHWEQFRFVTLLASRRGFSKFPTMGKHAAQFQTIFQEEGAKAAVSFIENLVRKRYRGVYHEGQLFRTSLSLKGGHKGRIRALFESNALTKQWGQFLYEMS